MSYGKQRGGRWGMNFISSTGPHHSLSTSNVRSDRLEDFAQAGYSSASIAAAEPTRSTGASVPPPTMQYSNENISRYSKSNKLDTSELIGLTTLSGHTGSSRAFANLGRKRVADDDDYFMDEQETDDLEYQPAPGSPSDHAPKKSGKEEPDSDDSCDPLDRFMENIEEEVRTLDSGDRPVKSGTVPTKSGLNKPPKRGGKGIRDDIEQEDEMEAYMRFMEENPNVGLLDDDDDEVYEYDAEGNIIGTEKKAIDPLPPVDHSLIKYTPFAKNFYLEHKDISCLLPSEVETLRQKLGLRVNGPNPLSPVCAFAHLGFDERLTGAIRKAGYTQPTPIQAQAVPLILAGRDVIGIGKTGSGKTAAFLWPLIVHIMDQPPLGLGDGPVGVVCAPTRELAQQIYTEAKKLAKVYNLTTVCAYGGGSLWEQQKACEAGCELLVCTPGRLIDLIKKKSTNLRRVTYMVFDEADKMFNLGFEPQVRSIANHVRPDRQTLLFSATFKSRLERLARDILTNPIRIIEGELGEGNSNITQIVETFDRIEQKWDWLTRNIVRFTTEGGVLVFVTRKAHSEEVANKLKMRDLKVLLIHGDMHQSDRNSVITAFKHQEAPILVATDVASRGLDIPSIRTVINYEVARDIDTHVHRIGRTGRAGAHGTAYTLLVPHKDPTEFAACLVQHLESAAQSVPNSLLDMANRCAWFVNNRSAFGANTNGTSVRSNLSFEPRPNRPRPGLGLGTTGDSCDWADSEKPKTGPAAAAAAGEGAAIIRPGLQADRFQAMKAAFASQYNRHFQSAGVEATHYTHPELLQQSYQPQNRQPYQQQQSNKLTPQKYLSTVPTITPVAPPPTREQPAFVAPPAECKRDDASSGKKKRSRWD